MLSLNVPKHHKIAVEQIYSMSTNKHAELLAKYLVDSNTYGKHNVYQVVKISVNHDKIEQVRRHDEYAGYMPDYDLMVVTTSGERHYLDGHKGVQYYIFDDESDAIHFAQMLDEYGDTDRLLGEIRNIKTTLSKISCGDSVALPLTGEIGWLKSEVDASITRIVARKAELEHEAIILK